MAINDKINLKIVEQLADEFVSKRDEVQLLPLAPIDMKMPVTIKRKFVFTNKFLS